ncbi:hypothetical protein SAMN05443144_11281 [Fodinibius roseus]|uniref:Uncharacterized protein n=1 Tax=Fodinibius roseus TaxID=1194090 RepID=A0A1M5DZU1_9BACT|nr:hypothetical protein [Fodinibius roseus]SHF72394.1 hypothetical protein SAMN05443144_11281 [Fodinibius roseus]
MQALLKSLFLTVLISLALSVAGYAQFEAPEIEKISNDRQSWFMNKFDDVKWTGQGFYDRSEIDGKQTNEIRARLKAAYGDPTKTIEDLIKLEDFRPAQAIQFEYWFVVDDSIPMMVLDIDGPFGRGLVYAGASKYIDLMPQIKRVFAKELMAVENLPAYQDYYYSPERRQWYNVTYDSGDYRTTEITSPPGMSY